MALLENCSALSDQVAAASLDDYQRFQMQHLTPLPGVRNVVTEIPLKTIKGVSSLPV